MCVFPKFSINGMYLDYVCEFKYLGHVINNKLLDDDDVKREIRCLFVRTNILLRRFGKCSVSVKLTVFTACVSMISVCGANTRLLLSSVL